MRLMKYTIAITLFFILPGCRKSDPVKSNSKLQFTAAAIGSASVSISGTVTTDLPVDQPVLLSFSSALNVATVPGSITLKEGTQTIPVDFSFAGLSMTVSVKPQQPLSNNTIYTIIISNLLEGSNGEEFPGYQFDFKTGGPKLSLLSYKIGGRIVNAGERIINIPLTLSVELNFSAALTTSSVASSTVTIGGPNPPQLVFTFSNSNKTLTITGATPLYYLKKYSIILSNGILGEAGETFPGFSTPFYTGVGNHVSGLPAKTDDELLTLVQLQTFGYFYDFGHPASGMARERNTSGNTVTTGGSGFGLMAMVVGIDRGFIVRSQGIARVNKIVSFLETADRFHGAWPHWIDGNTGHVIPFSANDNGADLVETSFMAQGLLTVRQYLTSTDTIGNNLINRINNLWFAIEWDWFRRCEPTCQNVLYWHWSPDKAWIMNFPLYGYFEEQITYFLAAASPTHAIPKLVYTNGFGKNGSIKIGSTYTFGNNSYALPLGAPAPLFWVQYSYLGLNPHFSDDYADYWVQNTNATLINHAYCSANPSRYAGYSASCWGLTASDNPSGYGAQSVGNDNGTITPTAALASFPYTPLESMKAVRFLYDTLGDRVWGQYGFYDAFNVTSDWYANSYLAIDQGPIIVMIENYRSGLLWNLFMSAPEVQQAKTTLGFQ